MHFLTGKHLPRRTFLRGLGATVALPFLDAMVPAGRGVRRGSAPSTARASSRSRWCTARPAATSWAPRRTCGRRRRSGATSTSSPTALELARAVPRLPDDRQQHRRAHGGGVRRRTEIGGDHFRSSAVFLTQAHPKQTEGSDVYVGTSLDQMYAQRFGQDTPIPSMQLCIENVDQAGGCAYGYSCVYTDSISWASPTEPLPVIRDPRVAFEKLFGAGGTRGRARGAPPHAPQHPRLDRRRDDVARSARSAPRIAQRLDQYLENIREVERRIQRIEARNTSGEPRELPGRAGRRARLVRRAREADVRPAGARLRGRHDARLLVQDGARRLEPRVPGERHRTGRSTRRRTTAATSSGVKDFYQINKYHVSMLPYFLDKLKSIQEGDSNLLDKTLIIYGSPMGDRNLHNHRRCPLILLGKANGKLAGNLHLKAPDGTPMANAMLSLMHKLGHGRHEELRRQHGHVPALAPRADAKRRHYEDAGRAIAAAVAALRTLLLGGRAAPSRRWPTPRCAATRRGARPAAAGRGRERGAGRRHDRAALGGAPRRRRAARRCWSTPARSVEAVDAQRQLHAAAPGQRATGNAAVVKALLEAGANAKAATTTGGATPLHFAAAQGSTDADHGAARQGRRRSTRAKARGARRR